MKLPGNIKAAIFDLDGTMLDSLGVWSETDDKFLSKRGIDLPPDYQDAIKSMSFPEAADYTIARFGLNESPAAIMAEWKKLTREAYATEVEPKPFVKEFLFKLHSENVKLALATSSEPELYVPALERHGLLGLFSAFVTTAEVGKGKNFPDVYFEAAKRLNVPLSDCVVFEDVLTAVKTAHTAGFYTVAVRDEFSAAEEAELRANSDYYLNSYSELL